MSERTPPPSTMLGASPRKAKGYLQCYVQARIRSSEMRRFAWLDLAEIRVTSTSRGAAPVSSSSELLVVESVVSKMEKGSVCTAACGDGAVAAALACGSRATPAGSTPDSAEPMDDMPNDDSAEGVSTTPAAPAEACEESEESESSNTPYAWSMVSCCAGVPHTTAGCGSRVSQNAPAAP